MSYWTRAGRVLLLLCVSSVSLTVCPVFPQGTKAALDLSPGPAKTAYNSAKVKLQTGRPNAAILELQAALDRPLNHDTTRFSLQMLLAEAYITTGKGKPAAQTLEALLPERPNSAELRLKLATAYASLGSYDASIDQYRAGL